MFTNGFLGGSDGKASACNAGDPGLIPGLGRSLGGGNGNPLQYSCLENSTDRGAWWATVHKVTKTQKQLSMRQSNRQTNMFFLKEIMRSISIHSFISEFHEIHEC